MPVRAVRPEAAEIAAGIAALRNSIWLDPLVTGEYGADVLAVAPELDDPAVVRDIAKKSALDSPSAT